MRPIIRLTAMPEETHFAPLGVLGYCLTRTHFLDPVLKSVRLPLKTVIHPPESKLLDVLVSILAGCRAIRQVNTRLRPDLALARAWSRERFAEQAVCPAGTSAGKSIATPLSEETIEVYEDEVTIETPLPQHARPAARGQELSVSAQVQACNDQGRCLAPSQLKATLVLPKTSQ